MEKTKIKLGIMFFMLFVLFNLVSCNKSNKQAVQDIPKSENVETVSVDENDYTETDEDLLNVDYKEFYDELAPHGEWVEVTDNDIGVELKKGTASGEKPHSTISFAEFFGVKDLQAADVAFGAFFIWRPSPDLSVSVVAGEPAAPYVPYSNGQWLYTDDGWYFAAATPCEEVTHHYGRWVFSPRLGWVWMPGRVWAPAWVDWREDPDYICWAPVPPGVYIVNNIVTCPPIYEERYVVVERRHFCEPFVYKYSYSFKERGDKIRIKEMTSINGVMIKDKRVINAGPDVTVIERDRGSKIEKVNIKNVNRVNDVKFSGNEVNTFKTDFKRVKSAGNNDKSITKPGKFEAYNDVKDKYKGNENPASQNDKKNNQSSGKNQGFDNKSGNNDKSSNRNNKSDNNFKSKGNDKQQNKTRDKGNNNNGSSKNDNKHRSSDGNVNKDNGSKQHQNKNNDGNSKQKNSSGKENKGGNKKFSKKWNSGDPKNDGNIKSDKSKQNNNKNSSDNSYSKKKSNNNNNNSGKNYNGQNDKSGTKQDKGTGNRNKKNK